MYFGICHPRYVLSPSNLVHLIVNQGEETFCHKKISDKWRHDASLDYRAWRVQTNFEICPVCDKYRQEYRDQFEPFVNSTHLTSRAVDDG